MCGRIALIHPEEKKLKQRFNLTKVPKDLKPRYNLSPSQDIPVILNKSPDELTLVHWGLIPHWAKEEKTGYNMINARAETIMEKPIFKAPLKHNRCLIIADTFYEWKRNSRVKMPYRIMLKDEGLFAFAGIWDRWEKDGKEIISCAIITTVPNALMKTIHDRMPVILDRDIEREWLSDISVDQAIEFLKSYNSKLMNAYPISPLVNSPSNNVPEVIKRI